MWQHRSENQMDFKQMKSSIKEISEIASSVPEQFRDKCFEMLLHALLAGEKTTAKEDGGATQPHKHSDQTEQPPTSPTIKLNTQLRLLLHKTGLTEEELNKVVLAEDNEVHFVQQPHPTKMREGQLEWSLLMALKTAIQRNALEADPEEIRSQCIDAGFYDKANFAANFKSPKFKTLFKGTLAPQGNAVALTPAGQDALGELVKRLAGGEK
jgi:hypothetical protein